jgi:hypothetical protein
MHFCNQYNNSKAQTNGNFEESHMTEAQTKAEKCSCTNVDSLFPIKKTRMRTPIKKLDDFKNKNI